MKFRTLPETGFGFADETPNDKGTMTQEPAAVV
jgi:hypothetical protein